MVRHKPRTIYKPILVNHTAITDSAAPPAAFFQSLRGVDADSAQGVQMKHIVTLLTLGLTNATSEGNERKVTGHMGYFKWPVDAATPSANTVDLRNRGSIFKRRPYTIQGVNPTKVSISAKSMRLTLGEEMWFFFDKIQEDDAATVVESTGISQFWETEA